MQPTIAELCAKYHNESVHTEHVTALALKLFDKTRARLKIPDGDRVLLEAAARLHDVAYSIDPLHHVEVSAQIILQEGIKGYRETQLPLIAAIMLLHGGKLVELLHHPLFEELTDAQNNRVLRLGAFLRVADGLDYGHVQTASIIRLQFIGKSVEVHVANALFPDNLTRANRKADLWRRVFPVDIRFLPEPVPTWQLLSPDLPPAEAARRLLSLHYKTILANIDSAIDDGSDIEPLHRIRVATRRMCALLRLFRKHLPCEAAKSIDTALRELGRELGPARDLDVWIDFLRTDVARQPLIASRLWQPFLHYQIRRRYLQDATVRRSLRGAHFGALRHRVARLLRAQLPELLETVAPRNHVLESLARKKFAKARRRVRRRARLRHSTASAKLHELRGTLRQARYVGEFFASLLDLGDHKLTERLHETEQILARIHDIDVALEKFLPEGPAAPRALVQQLCKQRQQTLKSFSRTWKRLRSL
jgi:CHAD domain-containing protein